MTLPGRATSQATQGFVKALGPWGRTLGSTGLGVGALGFGSYRVDMRCADHAEALRRALLGRRINLVDTACNYAGGESETLVGRVLSELAGDVKREEIVLVTKAGYVTGELLEKVSAEQDIPSEALMSLGRDHSHSFHPRVLDLALTQSLERLGVECVDVFLVHNPEYFLREGSQSEFRRRLAEAFSRLEEWVARGAIACYGVSSNTLGFDPSDPTATSIELFLDAARDGAGDDHHFKVIQCPLNLLERSALGELESTELGVLINRPLNAIQEGQVYRLARDYTARDVMGLREQARVLRGHERAFQKNFAPDSQELDVRYLYFARELAQGLATFPTRVALQDYVTLSHMPRVRALLGDLADHFRENEAFGVWREGYHKSLNAYIEASLAKLEERDAQVLKPVFDQALGPLASPIPGASWAQQAWWYCASRPGVSSVLAGIRQPAYVDEAHSLADLIIG